MHCNAKLQHFLCMLYVCICPLIHASPVDLLPRQYTGKGLGYLNNVFPGIYWAEADGECSNEQFNILAEATRMLGPFTDIGTDRWDGNPAFNRFFVSPRKAAFGQSWHDSEKNQKAYLSIRSNIVQLNKFPTTGKRDKNGKKPQQKRITYKCKETKGYIGKCATTPGLGAFTSTASATGTGWAITFCPYFFQQPYLNSVSNGEKKPLKELGTLYTYEHLLAHELLHCKVMGTKEPIIDFRDTVIGETGVVSVYGATRCNNWAWKYQGEKPGPVNIDTAINADNYAWFLTNNWFNRVFGWNENIGGFPFPGLQGSIISRDGDGYAPAPIDDNDPPQQPDDLPDDAVLASSLSDSTFIEAPNCHNVSGNGMEGENVVCEYVGEDYQDYLKEMSSNYATSGGCELSNECRNAAGNAVDPKCICTCNGEETQLNDSRCAGFKGSLPNPPAGIGQMGP